MVFSLQTVSLIVIFFWLIALTLLLLKSSNRFRSVFKDGGNDKISSILQELVKDLETTKKENNELHEKITAVEKDSQLHFKKISIIRFNPFKDTGGEQSFILALLDAQKNGIVISGLYARSGMRWYVKRVVDGKGIEHDLSEEEIRAVQEAK